jgi:hypothetical protein
MRTKWYIATTLVALFTLSGCHGHLHHKHAPGHDPDGPGNSENAQGHQ